MLRDLGHEVCGVANDAAGLAALLHKVTPDLITLDIDLGAGGEGLGLATLLEATGMVPIVFVAGGVDDQQRDAIHSIEGTALLVKPFTEPELRIAIALAFEKVRLAKGEAYAGGAPRIHRCA